MKPYMRKAIPIALTLLSTAGVVATAVLSSKATLKASKVLAEVNQDDAPMDRMEIVKTVAPIYAPAIVIGLATVVCIGGMGVFSIRSSASIASAYTLLDQSYRQYRSAAKEVYGKDADAKIKAVKAKKIDVGSDCANLYYPHKDRANNVVLFYDDYSQRYFNATMAAVMNAQYHVNRNLSLRGDVCLNEFYDFLGLDQIDGGYDVGWNICKLSEEYDTTWLDFNNQYVKLDDGMECYIITTMVTPGPIEF